MDHQKEHLIAAARTLLFNYGQGINTPHSNYLDICSLLRISPLLSPLPCFKPIPFRFSFFSKKFVPCSTCQHFMLYARFSEEDDFLSLASGPKLNWMRNFYWAQELLFSFSSPEIEKIFSILREEKRPFYTWERSAFQIKETENG